MVGGVFAVAVPVGGIAVAANAVADGGGSVGCCVGNSADTVAAWSIPAGSTAVVAHPDSNKTNNAISAARARASNRRRPATPDAPADSVIRARITLVRPRAESDAGTVHHSNATLPYFARNCPLAAPTAGFHFGSSPSAQSRARRRAAPAPAQAMPRPGLAHRAAGKTGPGQSPLTPSGAWPGRDCCTPSTPQRRFRAARRYGRRQR